MDGCRRTVPVRVVLVALREAEDAAEDGATAQEEAPADRAISAPATRDMYARGTDLPLAADTPLTAEGER